VVTTVKRPESIARMEAASETWPFEAVLGQTCGNMHAHVVCGSPEVLAFPQHLRDTRLGTPEGLVCRHTCREAKVSPNRS
jgi:hypothetical protein